MLRAFALCLGLAVACRSPEQEFACTDSAQCTLGPDQGICETSGFCSFATTSCPSGRSYGEGAPAALRDQCVDGTTTGAIGDWTRWGSGAPVASHARARVASADHLYVIGGRDPMPSDTYRDDVWVASIATGTWVQAAMSLPQTRGSSAAVAWGSYLYLLGGQSSATRGAGLPDVWVSAIDTAGAPVAWTTTASLCAGRYGLSVVAASGHLYAFGGANGNVMATTTSCFTTIDPATGQLQPWTETTPLPVALRNPVVVATDDRVFLVGGCGASTTACGNGASVIADVFAAAVRSDGTLGPWVKVSTLPDTALDRGATIHEGRIYVAGGSTGGAHIDRVWTALIEYGGQLGEWIAATPAHVLGSSTSQHRRPGLGASATRLYLFEYDDYVTETISAPFQ